MKAASIFARLFLAFVVLMPKILSAEGSSINDPIIMGTYANGSFIFNDSRSNNGYGNNYADAGAVYQGQQSEDIFYRFTIQGIAEVSVSTCASEINTYIHLLKNDGTPLEHNDDNGPLCAGSRASIKTTLTAGTYYLVVEGSGTVNGVITSSVNIVVQTMVSTDVATYMGNYTRVWEAMSAERDGNVLMSKPVRASRLTTTYFDGLGRAVETVVKQGSLVTATGGASDLVSVMRYDVLGRESDRYLPYAALAADGGFKDSALYYQNSFYLSPLSPVFGQGEQHFFSRTEQEPSPLARVLKTLAPGNSWVGSGRGVSLSYEGNTSGDSVRCWKVTEVPGGMGLVATDTTYGEGMLYKKVTTDEGGKQVIAYQDKQGKTVLKKVQEADLPSPGHSRWLCTYYVYDDLERLRAVLQPMAVQEMARSGCWTLDAVTLREGCFRYEYDARGRMILKKVPGAGAVYQVYDARDRLVMTQDANLRKPGGEQWLVTGYDSLNRPVTTGLWNDDRDLDYHLARAYDSDRYPVVTTGYELLTRTHYDDYQQLPPGLHSSLEGNYAASLDRGAADAQAITASAHTRGHVTWTTAKVLGQDKYLSTVNLYDDKGRLIQVQSDNYPGGIDITTTQYDFSGKVLGTCLEHRKSVGVVPLELATRNTYDDLGRVLKIEKNIGHEGYKSVAGFEYDALGALKVTTLAPGYHEGEGLETLTYDYNIRGWLLGVNRRYLQGKGSAGYDTRFFGFELGYDKPTTQAGTSFVQLQYNGNIAGTLWKSCGDEVRRKYDFTYDAVNRFGKADFSQNTDPASTGGIYNTEGANFSVHGFEAAGNYLMQYDANGNIRSMVQHGIRGLDPDAVIDALHYSYHMHSNKLQQVLDEHNDNSSVLGDFKYDPATKTAVDYGYDKNGNLVTDLNKHLSGATGLDLEEGGAITYNHLNLPSSIAVAGKGSIDYVYDAAGSKLAKTVHETGKPDHTTLYLAGGMVYDNDSLQFLAQEAGRIRPLRDLNNQVTGYGFDYFIRDHLGNVRMVLTDEQRSDRYPAASLEPAAVDSEQHYYRVPAAATVHKANVPGYPQADDYTTPNDYVQRLNGNGQRVGTSIVLRVMSGDRVNIRASSWYRQNGASAGNVHNAAADVVSSILQAIAGVPGAKTGVVTPGHQQLLASGVAGFLHQQDQEPGSASPKPKASLNWLLLDEQLHPVITNDGSNSGFQPVGEDQQLTIHQVTERPITKNGYLYIYLSNESTDVDVFFDNLQVTHVRGPLMEETHYYPFGLEMAAISSKAAGRMENNRKYNGIEFDNDLDINTYEAFYRNLDPQLGRWWQIDPKVDAGYESVSPYVSMNDDPARYSDFLGDEAGDPPQKGILETLGDGFMKSAEWINSNINPLTPIVESILGTSYESGFKESKPRSVALAEVGISLFPGGKVEGVAAKQIEKAIVKQEEKQIVNITEKTIATSGQNLVPKAVAKEIGILKDAANGKGNFSLGASSEKTSNKLGKSWVGEGAIIASDGKTLVSMDKLRQYRPPSIKKSEFATSGVQSNFEWRNKTFGQWQGNGHLNIK